MRSRQAREKWVNNGHQAARVPVALAMKRNIFLIALMAALVLGYGCTPEQKYKVLNFFFTGVPTPVTEKVSGADNKTPGKGSLATMSDYKAHGPYAAKLCSVCHERGSNALLMPVGELCLYCHASVLATNSKILHGPVATGACIVCHSPHGSPYPYFLNDESKKFCYFCHSRNDILKTPVHQNTDEQCTECHSAHSSDNEYLLK